MLWNADFLYRDISQNPEDARVYRYMVVASQVTCIRLSSIRTTSILIINSAVYIYRSILCNLLILCYSLNVCAVSQRFELHSRGFGECTSQSCSHRPRSAALGSAAKRVNREEYRYEYYHTFHLLCNDIHCYVPLNPP